jgi:hypothetical protein
MGCRVKEVSRQDRKEYPQYHQETIVLSGQIDHGRSPKFVVKSLETKRRSAKSGRVPLQRGLVTGGSESDSLFDDEDDEDGAGFV